MTLAWQRIATGFGLATLLAAQPAAAAVYSYVDWTAANVAQGTAEGTITLPDDSQVLVSFAAINPNATPGSLYGAQVTGGTNYWSLSTPYISTEVENAPPSPDILQLQGGQNQIYKVTLSEPIKDPIMAIVSLGQPGVRTTYDFDSPFTIVSQGIGHWGGSSMALKALDADILEGYEGHGTIRFIGTFSTFSWTVPTPEGWHGFTFGIRTTERLEPTGAGGAGGETGTGGETSNAGGTAAGGESSAGGALNVGGENAGISGAEAGVAGAPDTASGGTEAGSGGASGEGGVDTSAAGDGSERAQTQDTPGCNCSLPRGSVQLPALLTGLLLLVSAARRARRRR